MLHRAGSSAFTVKNFKKMKHAVLISLSLFLVFQACQNAQPKTDNRSETSAAPAPASEAAPEPVYACPMHPEVTGQKGDKCPKCKMDLVEKPAPAEPVYACPMHPEVTGKKGDKCPKCKMNLEEKK
jgi:predicted Zn-ribbon and HTH transcriptional regulator